MDGIRKNLTDASAEERQLLRERVEERGFLSGRARPTSILLESLTALRAHGDRGGGARVPAPRRAQAAEFRRRTSEQRLRVTLQSIGDAVIATDAAGA